MGGGESGILSLPRGPPLPSQHPSNSCFSIYSLNYRISLWKTWISVWPWLPTSLFSYHSTRWEKLEVLSSGVEGRPGPWLHRTCSQSYRENMHRVRGRWQGHIAALGGKGQRARRRVIRGPSTFIQTSSQHPCIFLNSEFLVAALWRFFFWWSMGIRVNAIQPRVTPQPFSLLLILLNIPFSVLTPIVSFRLKCYRFSLRFTFSKRRLSMTLVSPAFYRTTEYCMFMLSNCHLRSGGFLVISFLIPPVSPVSVPALCQILY